MRTRYIPAGIMLTAGAVTCIISIVKNEDIVKSLITLLVVLILFYVIGLVARFFVEKILKDFGKKDAREELPEVSSEEDTEELPESNSHDAQ